MIYTSEMHLMCCNINRGVDFLFLCLLVLLFGKFHTLVRSWLVDGKIRGKSIAQFKRSQNNDDATHHSLDGAVTVADLTFTLRSRSIACTEHIFAARFMSITKRILFGCTDLLW